MHIAYLDPGLSVRKGHNASMLLEFEESLQRERGHDLQVLASTALPAGAFADLRCRVEPAFRVDGYSRLPTLRSWHSASIEPTLAQIEQDLLRAGVLQADALLFPTMYPIHLAALARLAPRLRERPVALGFLMPLDFWCHDAPAHEFLCTLAAESIATLAGAVSLRAYSETGSYALGGRSVQMATLIPPWSSSRSALALRLGTAPRAAAAMAADGPTIGFFGSPFTSKGVQLLLDMLQDPAAAADFPGARLVVRLPEGHEELCRRLRQTLGIDATSTAMSNDAYLQQMAQVDAVWALYDPAHYGKKMSGIVPEALALGKPVLVSEGCAAIMDFLERYAPGAFVCAGYDAASLRGVLALGADGWHGAARCAVEHARVMRELKSMDRYLAVCGIG